MAKGKVGVMQPMFQKAPAGGAKASGKDTGKDTGIYNIDASQKIWVGSLPEGVSHEDILTAFGAAGTVLGATPVKNNSCCVAYSTAEEAAEAIATFNGGDFNGSTLEVDVWTQKTPAKGCAKGGSDWGSKGAASGFASKAASTPKAFGAKGSFGAAKGKTGVMQPAFEKTPATEAKACGKSSSKGKDTGIYGLDASQKIWVGSLPEGISEEDILTAFGAAGTVLGATPVKNNTCCVAYSTAEEAADAIATFNGGDFNGSTLQVDAWTQKTPAKGYSKGGSDWGSKGAASGFASKAASAPKAFGAKGSSNAWAPSTPAKGGFGGAKGWSAPTPVKAAGAKAEGKKGKEGPSIHDFDASQKVWVGNLPEGITTEDLETAFAAAGTVKFALTLPKNTASIAFETAEEAQYAIETLNGGDFNGNTIEVDVWTQKEKGKGKGKWGKF